MQLLVSEKIWAHFKTSFDTLEEMHVRLLGFQENMLNMSYSCYFSISHHMHHISKMCFLVKNDTCIMHLMNVDMG